MPNKMLPLITHIADGRRGRRWRVVGPGAERQRKTESSVPNYTKVTEDKKDSRETHLLVFLFSVEGNNKGEMVRKGIII